jgi:hypothetical protein
VVVFSDDDAPPRAACQEEMRDFGNVKKRLSFLMFPPEIVTLKYPHEIEFLSVS